MKGDTYNYAPFPTAWTDEPGDILDSGVLYDGDPTVRIDYVSADNHWDRSNIGLWISAPPGSHVVFTCWIKLEQSSIGDTDPYHGGRIGVDFYAGPSEDFGRIIALQSPTYEYSNLNGLYHSPDSVEGILEMMVDWNTGWVVRTIDYITPSVVPADGSSGGFYANQQVIPYYIIPWLQVMSEASETGRGWFAATSLYIDPEEPEPTPTLAPGVTPTPTIPGGIPPVTTAPIPPINYDPFYYGIRDIAVGSGFQIYCNTTQSTLGFDSEVVNSTFQIEVLTGEWNGTDVFMGITNRGGYLLFDSNSAAEIQVSHNNAKNLRLEYQNLAFSTLTPGHSWNGTIPDDTEDCYLRWSFPLDLPWEEDFMLWIGLFGLVLMISGLLLGAYSFKKYPIFSFDKETIWETSLLIYSFCAVFIGFGLVMTWLLS